MRIRQLDLIRYGCFTEVEVDLPPSDPDIHILVGPNEAGKSTVKAALEDLLFGIPARSSLDFIHPYRDMRLGAVLESNGNRLPVKRRKGMKDTLLDADDTPLASGERALSPFLGNAGRERFERMFSLDHERLRRGGQEILDAKGDLGEALFSASSGFQDLRGLGRALDEEAGELWTRRRSARRRYYQAEDRLREAERQIGQHTVNARKWRELRDELDARRKEHDELGASVREIDTKLRRLERIRRVARRVSEKARLESEVQRLGDVPALPEDAREVLRAAEEEERLAAQGAKQRQVDLNRVRAERAGLAWDESVLLRADEIDRLHERRLQVQALRSDLPKREAELAAAVRGMRELANDLGWESDRVDDLVARIPTRSVVGDARALLSNRANRLAEIQAARKGLTEAEERLADVGVRLRGADEAADVSRLRSILSATTKESSGIAADIRAARRELAEADATSASLFGRLRPKPEPIEAASALAVPSVQEVQAHRDARLSLVRKLERIGDRLRSTEEGLNEARKTRDRIVAEERPVGPQELADVRSERDTGWQLVRRKYIEHETVSDEEVRAFSGPHSSLGWSYEKAVQSADNAADRWVQTANAAAQLEQANRTVDSLLESLKDLREEHSAVEDGREATDADWEALWQSVPFEPLAPEAMLPWLETHELLCQALSRRDRSRRELQSLREQETAASEAVLSELATLGVDTGRLRDAGLPAILERGLDERQRHEQAAQSRAALEMEARRAAASVEAKRREVEQSDSAMSSWQAEWSRAVTALGFPETAMPDSVEAQIEVIERMRQAASEMANLRDKRVELIRRDIESFERDVRTFVASVAPDLSQESPNNATIGMEQRLAASRDARKDAAAKDKQIQSLEQEIQRFDEKTREAREAVVSLQAAAGVTDTDSLRTAIEKAEMAKSIGKERQRVLRELSEDGDGLSVEEMEQECQDVDLDQAASDEAELRSEIDELRSRQESVRDSLRDAEDRFREVGGGGAAAVAEGARQDALAEIREIAQQYVRRRTAALLLQWAVERNRRERQGPMLRRAGEIFAELTLGSFEALELDFDENDRARLVGRRPSGGRVDMNGMSSGSADQLYLALRVAALEGYAGDAGSLPFVADDLFVNFDDRRSAAGFRVLARLAHKYQVIFLTHHDHLAEVAKLAVPGGIRVWALPRRTVPSVAGAAS